MIIEMQQRTVGDSTYNYVTHNEEFYCIGYNDDLTVGVDCEGLVLMNVEERPNPAGSEVASILIGFGSDNWEEFNEEIERIGIIFPEV